MKYEFNSSKLHKYHLKYVIAGFSACILLVIINRLYNTIANSSRLSEVLILLFVLSVIILSVILAIYRYSFKKYKNSYISIHKGVLKYRRNNTQNFYSEYHEYPEFAEYKTILEDYDINKSSIVIYGDISLSLISDTEYISKTKSIFKLTIPPYYSDWDKIVDKIKKITSP